MLLVKGWTAKSSWTFPKGKINQDETELNCAIREVMEEIGFDVSSLIKETDYIEQTLRGEQRNRLYIIPNVSEQTPFAPQTRKEISDIKWHWLKELPGYRHSNGEYTPQNTKFYMIRNFIGPLQGWIDRYRKTPKKQRQKLAKSASAASLNSRESLYQPPATPEQAKSVLKSMLGINDTSSAPLPATPSPAMPSASLLQHNPSSSPLAVPQHIIPTSRNLLDYYGTTPSSSLPQPQLSRSFPHSSGGSLDSGPLSQQRPPFMNHQASLLSILNSSNPSISGSPVPMPGPPSLPVRPTGAMHPAQWTMQSGSLPPAAQRAPSTPLHHMSGAGSVAPQGLTQQQSLLHILHGGSAPAMPSVIRPDVSASATLTHEHAPSHHLKELLGLGQGASTSVRPDPLMSSVSSDAAAMQQKPQHSTPVKNDQGKNNKQGKNEKKVSSTPVKAATEQQQQVKKTPNNKRSARVRSEDNLFKMDEDVSPQQQSGSSNKQQQQTPAQRKKKPLTQKPQTTPIQPTRILKRGEIQNGNHVPPTQQMSSIQLDEKKNQQQPKTLATTSAVSNPASNASSMKDFQFNVADLVGQFSKANK
jgi:ADP-ribose pyrophosphatase YjhB (NUDIX family)